MSYRSVLAENLKPITFKKCWRSLSPFCHFANWTIRYNCSNYFGQHLKVPSTKISLVVRHNTSRFEPQDKIIIPCSLLFVKQNCSFLVLVTLDILFVAVYTWALLNFRDRFLANAHLQYLTTRRGPV